MVFARTCLVLLCASSVLWGQTEVVERHDSGTVHRRYTVDAEGKRAGAFQEFDAEGTLRVQAVYREGQLEGRCKVYHANGKRQLWANYRGGRLNGRYTTFREDGKKHVVAHYHDDLRHGKYEAVYENGQLKERTRYRHAKLHGSLESFFENGNPHLRATFENGKRHGKYEEFNADQSHSLTEHFHHGTRHGVYQVVDKGNLVIDQVWDMGKIHKIRGVVAYPVPEDNIRKEIRRILRLPPAAAAAPSSTAPKPARVRREVDTPEEALRRLKAYRFLCRVPYENLRLDPKLCEHCESGAKLCERIGRIEHEPKCPKGMDQAEYRRGLTGTMHRNLHQGSGLVGSVDAYMEDHGENNLDHVGHRRWCLNPRMRRTGFGSSGGFCAMWAHDEGGTASFAATRPSSQARRRGAANAAPR